METQQFEIYKAESVLEWVGRKITGTRNGVANAQFASQMARAKSVIGRTRYDMKFCFGSFFANLGYTLVYNDFILKVSLT